MLCVFLFAVTALFLYCMSVNKYNVVVLLPCLLLEFYGWLLDCEHQIFEYSFDCCCLAILGNRPNSLPSAKCAEWM